MNVKADKMSNAQQSSELLISAYGDCVESQIDLPVNLNNSEFPTADENEICTVNYG